MSTSDALALFWVHDVTLRPLLDEGPEGDALGDPLPLTGFVDDKAKLIRGPQGDQLLAETTLYLPATTGDLPVGSEVTLPPAFGARVTTIVAVARHDAGGLDLPEHVEVSLT